MASAFGTGLSSCGSSPSVSPVPASIPDAAANHIRVLDLFSALQSARRIISEIDEYQKRPDSGSYGVECACCMGELLDDDRAELAHIDAIIASATGAA